jgi:hypothetical protein
MAFAVTRVARQSFILARLSLSIAQSVAIPRGPNGAVILGHRIADFDIVVAIIGHLFVLILVLITLPLTATVL